MHLLEHEGKALLTTYDIAVPHGMVISAVDDDGIRDVATPCIAKAQVRVGGRGRLGGIRRCATPAAVRDAVRTMVGSTIAGAPVEGVLLEECVDGAREYYVSVSYDTASRGPVLAFARAGGTEVSSATIIPLDPFHGVTHDVLAQCFTREAVDEEWARAAIAGLAERLWACFDRERLLLAEVNPLFVTPDGRAVAGDAKIVCDDDVVQPSARRFLSLGGDIAILASGGGASLLNIDALLEHGGRPANYTEYSGNPPAEVVRDLTVRVLSQEGLRGCWVIGGTANFTDIYETMRGFVEGLRAVRTKPTYPIVVRRDGPRQAEAFAMLQTVARDDGLQCYAFGSETPMEESARIMVKLAYGHSHQ